MSYEEGRASSAGRRKLYFMSKNIGKKVFSFFTTPMLRGGSRNVSHFHFDFPRFSQNQGGNALLCSSHANFSSWHKMQMFSSILDDCLTFSKDCRFFCTVACSHAECATLPYMTQLSSCHRIEFHHANQAPNIFFFHFEEMNDHWRFSGGPMRWVKFLQLFGNQTGFFAGVTWHVDRMNC